MPKQPLTKEIMMKSLLIFDLDGTLVDSANDLADATNATLQALNKPTFDEKIIRGWVGNGAKVLIARALSGSQTIDPNLDESLLNDALSIFFKYYGEHTCIKTQPYEGVDKGLKQLKNAGFQLAIITNKPLQFVPTILQTLGWQDLFAITLGGDSLPVKKPDPTPLLYVCEQLNIAPNQSYMIGDSKNDILAGKNANIDTLALTYGYNYGEDIRLHQPTQVFDNFDDLVTFIING